jgi:acetyltransferase-like isoleucine patch superfamily enzyme
MRLIFALLARAGAGLNRLAGSRSDRRVRMPGIGYAIRYLRNPRPRSVPGILRSFNAAIGPRTTFKGALIIENARGDEHSAGDFRHLRIGRNCYIGESVYFDLAHEITIADNAVLSGRVSILTHADCNRSAYLAAEFPRVCMPVMIEEGAWIGFGATIFPGVTIGREATVAAGSVLREDVPPRTVYAGVPARAMRSIPRSG